MAERPEQIEKHIQSTRSELGNNLQELEYKVKQEADWRTHFERNPILAVGLAFGGGVLLGTLAPTIRGGAPSRSDDYSPAKSSFRGMEKSQVSDTLENVKGALIAFAGMKVRGLLDEYLPGFSEHYDKAERQNYIPPVSHAHSDEPASTHRM